MPAVALGITVDAKQVTELFKRAPEATTRVIRQLVEGSAIDVQRELIRVTPVGVTGAMRRSVQYKFSATQMQAVIEPNVKYAESVEYGGRPRWVSVKPGTPLAQWARLKGINPYALQHSIARKGTKAHPFVTPTYNKMKPKVLNDIAAGLAQYAKELDNGNIRG